MEVFGPGVLLIRCGQLLTLNRSKGASTACLSQVVTAMGVFGRSSWSIRFRESARALQLSLSLCPPVYLPVLFFLQVEIHSYCCEATQHAYGRIDQTSACASPVLFWVECYVPYFSRPTFISVFWLNFCSRCWLRHLPYLPVSRHPSSSIDTRHVYAPPTLAVAGYAVSALVTAGDRGTR